MTTAELYDEALKHFAKVGTDAALEELRRLGKLLVEENKVLPHDDGYFWFCPKRKRKP